MPGNRSHREARGAAGVMVALVFGELRLRLHRLREAPAFRGARSPIVVAGTQKTGTTWLARLLAAMPLHRAAGHVDDERRWSQARPGDVIHSHRRYRGEPIRDYAVVVACRDPRDQVVSRAFHLRRAPTKHYELARGLAFDDLLALCITGGDGFPGVAEVFEVSLSWLRAGAADARVRYEDLVTDTPAELARLCGALRLPASPALVSEICAANSFERRTVGWKLWSRPRARGQADPASHLRKGIVGDWRNHFTARHRDLFERHGAQLLDELGYDTAVLDG